MTAEELINFLVDIMKDMKAEALECMKDCQHLEDDTFARGYNVATINKCQQFLDIIKRETNESR